jgi:hypothetical protein
MPCGYEMTVRSGAKDMYLRMHKKACKKCEPGAKPIVVDLDIAGERLNLPAVSDVNDPRLAAYAKERYGPLIDPSPNSDYGITTDAPTPVGVGAVESVLSKFSH